MQHDIDALVELSRSGINKSGEHDLWRAAMALETWWFVARGEGEEAEPLIATVDGKAALVIFTDEGKAAAFAKAREMRRSDPRGSNRDPDAMQGLVLTMDVPDALAYCEDLAKEGVEWALFNSGMFAFQCPMLEMQDRFRRFGPR